MKLISPGKTGNVQVYFLNGIKKSKYHNIIGIQTMGKIPKTKI